MDVYRWLKPLLFRMDPERAHRSTIAVCAAAGRFGFGNVLQPAFTTEDSRLAFEFAGLSFPNPVGLAAGFDKSGRAVPLLSRLGFGSIEIGSVSERSSEGNTQRPRLWRLERDAGLRVFYGVPNDGAAVVAARLRKVKWPVPLGVSIVETNTGKVQNPERAATELARAGACFIGIADYLVLNLSCPNTPHGSHGLFDDPQHLAVLLAACAAHREMPPVLLKITPPGDPTDPRGIESIFAAVDHYPFVKGFILNIVNPSPYTTLRTPRDQLDRMRGGITGPSLREPTNAALQAWFSRINRSKHVLVGVGGINDASGAYAMIRSGASWIQLYTALVYQGPGLVKQINAGLIREIERDGIRRLSDAVGLDVPSPSRVLQVH